MSVAKSSINRFLPKHYIRPKTHKRIITAKNSCKFPVC